MHLAQRAGGVIVSADSRQVYRRFDIGTAKPSAEDRAAVPHRGIDVVEPTERYSAARFAAAAAGWMTEAGDRPVLCCGGTGFYLQALVAPLAPVPDLDPDARAALQRELAGVDTAALRTRVATLDPARAPLGRAQLLRALEVALLTGRPLSAWHADAPVRPPRPARWLLVDPGASLRDRIAHRLDGMFAAGWVDEAGALAAAVPADAPAWQACGYRTVRDVALGRAELAAARATIFIETRQYAKRQRTWFRHQLAGARVTTLDPAAPDALARAAAWWEGEA